MKMLRVMLIILGVFTLSSSAVALSIPFQFGSLMSFPSSSTMLNPSGMFTSDLANFIPSDAMTGIQSVSSNDNGNSFSIPIINSNWNWPDTSYNKWTANGVTPPSTYTQSSGDESQNSVTSPPPAPAMTQATKTEAIKIAATSPLCKQYNEYPDNSWNVQWDSPYDGHTIQVWNNPPQGGKTNLDFFVDIDNSTIVRSYVNPTL